MLYNFYIYNRKGKCLFYKEWRRPQNTLADDPIEDRKLVFGMLFSLKALAAQMQHMTGVDGIHIVKTDTFSLHHFQSVSGIMFVLNTDVETPGICFHCYLLSYSYRI